MVNAPERWPSLLITLWSVLGLLAGCALLGFTFLDMAVAGDLGLSIDSDRQYPRLDRVSYTLAGFTYLHGSQVLTGPHPSLPLTLGWLILTALLMWNLWRRWGLSEARQALRASLLVLAGVTLIGGATLWLAMGTHNQMLQAPTLGQTRPVSTTSAQLTTLDLWQCVRWVENQGCQDRQESTFPNPALWAVVGVFITAGAGLWRPAEQGD